MQIAVSTQLSGASAASPGSGATACAAGRQTLEDEVGRGGADVELLHERLAHVLQPRDLRLDALALRPRHRASMAHGTGRRVRGSPAEGFVGVQPVKLESLSRQEQGGRRGAAGGAAPMSGAKAKGGGEAITEGAPVRVLYDSTDWYHGEVQKVLGPGANGSTKCRVWFEDGETVELDVPSKEAQVRGSARSTCSLARSFARPPARPGARVPRAVGGA
jgi:hypothetical protein